MDQEIPQRTSDTLNNVTGSHLYHAPGKQEHNTHQPTKTSTGLCSDQFSYDLANTRYSLQERKFIISAETEPFAELQVPQLQFKQH